jgi:hypothetical protein
MADPAPRARFGPLVEVHRLRATQAIDMVPSLIAYGAISRSKAFIEAIR